MQGGRGRQSRGKGEERGQKLVVKHAGEIGQRKKQVARSVAAAAADFPLDGGGGADVALRSWQGLGAKGPVSLLIPLGLVSPSARRRGTAAAVAWWWWWWGGGGGGRDLLAQTFGARESPVNRFESM